MLRQEEIDSMRATVWQPERKEMSTVLYRVVQVDATILWEGKLVRVQGHAGIDRYGFMGGTLRATVQGLTNFLTEFSITDIRFVGNTITVQGRALWGTSGIRGVAATYKFVFTDNPDTMSVAIQREVSGVAIIETKPLPIVSGSVRLVTATA